MLDRFIQEGAYHTLTLSEHSSFIYFEVAKKEFELGNKTKALKIAEKSLLFGENNF